MSITIQKILAPLPATTRGQATPLSCDPKGEYLAYAAGKSIFLRSIDNPSLSKQYVGHTTETTVARFSPSGFYVASGDESGTIKIWDAEEASKTKGEYQIISGRIYDIAWDGDSQRIIGVGRGKGRFGHCFAADGGNSVGEIIGHHGVINSVSIRQMRPIRAATGSDDMSTTFLTGVPFKYACSNTCHKSFVYGVAFSPNGEQLVSVGGDRRIAFYDGKTGAPNGTVVQDAHMGSIFGVSWSHDSRQFVTASADKTVKIWDAETQQPVETWVLGNKNISDQQLGVTWTPRSDGTIISVNLAGDLVYLHKGTRQPSRIVQGHNKSITAITTSVNKQTIWTGSYDGRVCSWDTMHDDAVHAQTIAGTGHEATKISALISTENATLSAAWDDSLRLIDHQRFEYASQCMQLNGQPQDAAPTFEGGKVFVATTEGVQVFVSTSNGWSLEHEHKTSFAPSAIAVADEFIALGVKDSNELHILSRSFETVKTSTVSRSGVSKLAFSPRGRYLAVGNGEGNVICLRTSDWEVETTRWGAHTARVTALSWNAEETHAVSGSLDTNVYVWSVANPGQRVVALNAHKDGVSGVGWLAQDKYVVSTGADATVKIWSVSTKT